MSASDAVDGSSKGTRVPRRWELLELPRFGGAKCKRSPQSVSTLPSRSFKCIALTVPVTWSFAAMINAWHQSSETSKRLDEIPGVGPALATALVASVADPRAFRSGRDFSAWIGLVPRQHSSGGKDKLGSISKQGDRYLRGLFTAGALAVIRYAKIHGTKHRPWLAALLARRPTKVAAIALANKLSRIAWAVMAKGERYKEPAALAA